MKRTPEAIADSVKALEIGRQMLQFMEPNSHSLQVCMDGLQTLKRWLESEATVAECRASSFAIHELARNCGDLRETYALRSVAHAIATAHVSSHLEACRKYSVKALERP